MATLDKTVVVTGGSGFVGTHLIRSLVADADTLTVFVLDLLPPSVKDKKIVFIECDIRNPITFIAPGKVEVCYHLAAACREPGFEWDEYFETNYRGTQNVSTWAATQGIHNLVFTSTAMVFCASDRRYAEGDLPNADTAYGISKALAEEVLHGWMNATPGRRLRIVRPGVVFGHQGGGNFARLYTALRSHAFFYIGRDSTVKSAIYVKDLVKLLRTVAVDQQTISTFHGVYPEATTIKSICQAYCKAFHWRRRIVTIPYRPALAAAFGFEQLNAIGLKNPVHHRRIQKLYHSTNLSGERLKLINFRNDYSLEEAFIDWHQDCAGKDLH